MSKIKKQINYEVRASFPDDADLDQEALDAVEDIVNKVNETYRSVIEEHEHMRLFLIDIAGYSKEGEVVRKALQGLRIELK